MSRLKEQHYIPTRPVPTAASADFYHHSSTSSISVWFRFQFECRRQLIVPDDGKAPHSAHP